MDPGEAWRRRDVTHNRQPIPVLKHLFHWLSLLWLEKEMPGRRRLFDRCFREIRHDESKLSRP